MSSTDFACSTESEYGRFLLTISFKRQASFVETELLAYMSVNVSTIVTYLQGYSLHLFHFFIEKQSNEFEEVSTVFENNEIYLGKQQLYRKIATFM